MSRICNVALIGQKFMGRAHSNAWRQAPSFFELPVIPRLLTVSARDRKELEAFATRWGWRRFTTRWQDIAEDLAVHLVDIATPNDAHAEQAIAMLEAGKNVACEKPLAATREGARAMRDAARKAPGKTFVWFNYRRCPAVALAHKMVHEGKLGRIYHVRATYLQSWGEPETPMSWRFRKRIAGSGAHGDLNAHIVDLARFITGDEISEVHGGVARNFIRERKRPQDGKWGRSDVDDCLAFVASFKGGATATFEASRVAWGHQNRNTIEINAESGSLAFDFEDMNVLHYCKAGDGLREGGWRRIMCTSAGDHPYAAAWWPDGHLIGYEHGFTNMVADILRVLGGRKPEIPLPDFAHAYETQRVLEAAMISARERQAVRISEVR